VSRGQERAGVALCLLSAAGFGAMSIFAKLAYGAGVGVIPLLTVRFALAAAALWALWRLRGGDRPPARQLAAGFALGLVAYSPESGLFFGALTRLHASLASLLLYVYPSFVVAGALLLGRERVTRRRLAALASATAGVALVLAGGGAGRVDVVGVALALAAALSYAGYILAADRVTPGADPLAMAGAVTTGAAVAFAGAALVSGRLTLDFSAAGWGWVGAIALVSTVVAVAAFLAGLARVGPGRAAILSTIEPPFTVLLAFLVFGESLRPVQLVGGALVLAAVLVLQVRSRIREPSPQPAPPSSARPLPSRAA
jgi:drug/metabolite transporter (DMT)-like permease